MQRLWIVVLSIIFLGGIIPASSVKAAEKIGYINLSRVFDQYRKTMDYDKELEKKGDKKQNDREKKISQIKRFKEELELLSEKGKEKKQKRINKKVKELQDFDLATRTDLRRERDEIVREILEEINKAIEEYGKSEGYFLILNDRVILYADGQSDLTDEIVKILNDRYKK